MDMKEHGKELNEDVTRESLIAISYKVPDTDPNAEKSPKNEDVTRESLIAISYKVPDTDPNAEKSPKAIEGEKVIEPLIRDGDEKYRSKLISISYSQSPDMKVLPLLPGQPDG